MVQTRNDIQFIKKTMLLIYEEEETNSVYISIQVDKLKA